MSALTDQEWEAFCKIAKAGQRVRLRHRYANARRRLKAFLDDEWASANKIADCTAERDRAAELVRRELGTKP